MLILISCTGTVKDIPIKEDQTTVTVKARLLDIFSEDSVWKVTVKNPWQNTSDTRINYYFSELISNDTIISLPVKKVVCFSSSHIAFISALGEQERISGISGIRYVCDSITNVLVNQGKITEVGYENNIDYDFFVREKPDVALIYGVGTEHARYIKRLEDLGVKVIYIAEYLEDTPLGRLEWIKLFGILFCNYEKADSLFRSKSDLYNSLVSKTDNPPLIFSGSPIGDNWYVPGGKSFMSNLISDAGGKYVFSNDNRNESFPVSFETAYEKLLNSDIWINCDLPSEVIFSGNGSRYTVIKPAINKMVYSNTGKMNINGGNDFWESAVVCPEVLLNDLKTIFKENNINGNTTVYYRKL